MKYIAEYKHFREKIKPLNESLTSGIITDAIQFMIGAAVEYGVAAGTLGVGTPAACALETAIDVGFASERINSVINQVTEVKNQFGSFSDIVNKSMESFDIFKSGNFDQFYQTIKKIIIDGIELLKGEESVDKIANKLKEILSKLISKITDAVAKGLKVLIPDATIGLGLSTSIKAVVGVASDNGYNIATGAVEKLGEYKKYLIDPEEFPKLLKNTFPEAYKMIDGFKQKIDEMGWVKATIMFGTSGIILKKMGPTGLDKLSQTIKEFEPTVLELVKKILNIIVPTTFIFLAMIQILLKDEYKKQDTQDKKEDESDTFDFEAAKKDPENYEWKESKYTKDYKFEPGEELKYWKKSGVKDEGEDYKGTTAFVMSNDDQKDKEGNPLKPSEIKVKTDKEDKGFIILKSKVISTKKDKE